MMAVIVFVCMFLILLGVILLKTGKKDEVERVPVPLSNDEIVWKTYTSKEFSFTVEYPEHWNVFESEKDTGGPKINFYPTQRGAELPMSHFSEETNFSIFPEGVATGGVVGESKESHVVVDGSTDSRDFVLTNKDVWATSINFSNPPSTWQPWGFLWAHHKIDSLEYSCLKDGQVVSAEGCDPFAGDELLRSGMIDSDLDEIFDHMFETFQFTR